MARELATLAFLPVNCQSAINPLLHLELQGSEDGVLTETGELLFSRNRP